MSKRKNLIFLFADQWRRDSIGFMSGDEVITPNIDAFSKESMVFLNAVSTGPLCSPSRASILTGTYPLTHGVWTNCKKGLNDVWLKDESVTITDILKENKYYIGYIGKWHLDNPEENVCPKPKSGARNWDAYTPPGSKRHGVDYWYSYGAYDNHFNPHYWENSDEMIEVKKWSVEHETDKAIEFIEKNKEKDFALFLSWNPPHTPLDMVPEKYLEMYKNKKLEVRPNVTLNDIIDHPKSMEESLEFTDEEYQEILKKYYAAITGVDDYFGKLIKYLKDNNLYDDTIIVLTADHGEMLCSHGLWSKHVWYEESIGVPFMVKYDKDSIGKTDVVLSGVDVMPTLLSLLDLKIPNTVEGTNLKDCIVDKKDNDNKAVIVSYPGQVKAINSYEKLGLKNLDYGWRAIRSKTHTFVVNKGYNPNYEQEILLYDNINDKYQLKPLVIDKDTDNKLAKEMQEYLEEWLVKYKEGFKI
ncbi:sulfatase family protein [Oceanivirga salmonicida]|uniref:sulfatase family protein n=1 Tax=Oceanivirga salmonicida TaxID=1769291 RepID=UPI0012E1A52A|nr:sulfatase [Oceanivirga salmonicida]